MVNFSAIDREKLLQYKLIMYIVLKKVPEYRYPLYLVRNWR